MKIFNITIVLLLTLILVGCATTKSYQDAGVYNGKNYTFDVTWEDKGLFRETYVSINDERVLTIDRVSIKTANCQKISFYVNQCSFKAAYAGNDVDVIQTIDGQLYQQNAYYKILFNGTLVRTITTPLI